MATLSIFLTQGEVIPSFKIEGSISTDEELYINLANSAEEGCGHANFIISLRDLLKQGQCLKKIHVFIGKERGEPAKDLLYFSLGAVFFAIPFIPVNSLVISGELLYSLYCLDDMSILKLLKQTVLDPKNSLKYLELGNLTIEKDMSLDCIGEMLSHPHCRLEGFSFVGSTIPNIGRWIKNYLGKTRLHLLSLADILGFNTAAAFELSKVLKNHPSLKYLDIWYLNVTNEGAKAIAEALKTNTVLEYMNFTNNIGEDALIEFAEALKVNTRLTVLNLSDGELSEVMGAESSVSLDKSAIAFAEAFKVNNTLVYLNLSRGEATEAGTDALRQGLLQNQSLQAFHCLPDAEVFKEILGHKRRTRKQHLLWTIWGQFGDVLSLNQSIAEISVQNKSQSVFASCNFRPFSFITADGRKYFVTWDTHVIEIAEALGFLDSSEPAPASSSDYTSYFQWLPKEMVEDTFVLPLSKAAITAEQQRINQRRVPDGFWEQVQDQAKRRKIEGEKKEIDDAASLHPAPYH